MVDMVYIVKLVAAQTVRRDYATEMAHVYPALMVAMERVASSPAQVESLIATRA